MAQSAIAILRVRLFTIVIFTVAVYVVLIVELYLTVTPPITQPFNIIMQLHQRSMAVSLPIASPAARLPISSTAA